MSIFVKVLSSNRTICYDINVDTTLNDIATYIKQYILNPIFIYQGIVISDNTQTLADLGICPETTIEVTEVEYIIFKCDNYFIENNQCHIVLDINRNTIHYIEYDGAILIKTGKLEQLESNKYKAIVIRCCSYCTNLVECHLYMDNIGSHCDELYIDTDTGSIEDRTRLYRTDRLTIPQKELNNIDLSQFISNNPKIKLNIL